MSEQALPLKSLIRGGETNQVEFKKTFTHLPKVAKTLVAFANNRGGKIIVGVLDNHDIIGVNPEEETYMVLEAAENWCYPAIHVNLHEVEMDGATLLVVDVPESPDKPHHARDKQNAWKVYVRSEDQCLQADEAMARHLRQQPLPEERQLEQRTFTRHEEAALAYLKKMHKLTVKDYAKLINVSRNRAGKILFGLMREGLLFEHGQGRNAVYVSA